MRPRLSRLERSQDPELHTAWDIRFNHIAYVDETDERGFHLMDYRTNIALGITIKGYGRYLGNRSTRIPASSSTRMTGSRSSEMAGESGYIVRVRKVRFSKPFMTTTHGMACLELFSIACCSEACCNWRPSGVSRRCGSGVPGMKAQSDDAAVAFVLQHSSLADDWDGSPGMAKREAGWDQDKSTKPSTRKPCQRTPLWPDAPRSECRRVFPGGEESGTSAFAPSRYEVS